jgi:hypothetical protein
MNFTREDVEFLAKVLSHTNGHDKPEEYARKAGEHFDALTKSQNPAAHEPPSEG